MMTSGLTTHQPMRVICVLVIKTCDKRPSSIDCPCVHECIDVVVDVVAVELQIKLLGMTMVWRFTSLSILFKSY